MTTKELYTKDAKVWVEHPVQVWEGATVTGDYHSGVLVVRIDQSGEIRQIKITDEKKLPPLRNPPLLIGKNDLTSLSYLHEPAVLHNLRVRFCDRNAIYTYCGIVLVAINPYCDLPIYSDETMMAYRGHSMGELDPHIFAVSEEAYTKLERENINQSLIVSGESGAGKTVSAKYAMRYFAAVRGNVSEAQVVERKILASSLIMEAIGNAKTTRNDNSSRFGKFIEIHFDPNYWICGASMRTYLLEKSRVTCQSAGERNYHIFYQLCAAARQMPDLMLDHQDFFHYLNQGGSPEIDGVDDLEAFNETKTALTTLGVSESEQRNMFTVLAAILHLGNVELSSSEEDDVGAYIDPNDVDLKKVCSLLGILELELSRWLTHRRIAPGHEVIVYRMDRQSAAFARDALAKRMYAALWAWLVKAVSGALDTGHAKKHFIGVLDIYGFETFEMNSFEQFCINYANEKLQQQFNSHVFKLEEEEYIKEGISWKKIDFCDNQPCIELIEGRLGVLALLNEQCRVPQGSDAGFAIKLYDHCAKHPHFLKPRLGNTAFIIKHFADNVEYQCKGFLEKNRDAVFEKQLACIKSATSCPLIQDMLTDAPGDSSPPPFRKSRTPPPRRASGQKQTVGAQFRASLSALMATLSATTPHYVRCIKPNDTKTAFQFDAARAINQLRAYGVLETIRISSAGFPSRWSYQDFSQRYRLLCRFKDIDRSDAKATCLKILLKHVKKPDEYKLGATKIFLRAGQVAYLERVRAELQWVYCVRVQSCVRGFLARRRCRRLQTTLKQAREADELRREREARIRKEAMLEAKRDALRRKPEEKVAAAAAAAREAAERERRAALRAAERGRMERQAHVDQVKEAERAREADELHLEWTARKKKEAIYQAKRDALKSKLEEKMAAAAAAREAVERERRAALRAAERERLEKQAHADKGKMERLKAAKEADRAREADELRREREARIRKEAMLEAKRDALRRNREKKMAAAAAAREAVERERRAALRAAERERLQKQALADKGKEERLKEVERRKQETARKAAESERRRAEEQAHQQRLADEQRRAASRKQQEATGAIRKEKEVERRQLRKGMKEKEKLEANKETMKVHKGESSRMEPVYVQDLPPVQYLPTDYTEAQRDEMRLQHRMPSALVDQPFSVREHTPDPRDIFPNIDGARLERTSSAESRTPPPRLPEFDE